MSLRGAPPRVRARSWSRVAEHAADLLGERLDWDTERRAKELAEYRTWLERLAVPQRGRAEDREVLLP